MDLIYGCIYFGVQWRVDSDVSGRKATKHVEYDLGCSPAVLSQYMASVYYAYFF
ncbi:hypothetical protein D3C71_1868250 [compost metagenome]